VSAHVYRVLFWLGVFVVLVLAFALLQGVLMPFAAAFVIAYFLDPLVDRLQMWRISRGLASLMILLGFLLGVGLIVFLLVPLVQGQIVRLVVRFPGLVGAAQDQFGNLMQLLRSLRSASSPSTAACGANAPPIMIAEKGAAMIKAAARQRLAT
jgi:predicted PurR-regulated permease PerM